MGSGPDTFTVTAMLLCDVFCFDRSDGKNCCGKREKQKYAVKRKIVHKGIGTQIPLRKADNEDAGDNGCFGGL